jgi:hypothetical protein
MGQLKFARGLSEGARAFADAEPQRQFAANAFEQNASVGPKAGPIGLSGGESTGPLGAGAPDVTQPSVGPGENKTPYQDKVDKAKQDNKMAMMLTLLGLAMMGVGAALLMKAKAMAASPDPATKALAAKLAMAGKAALALGAAALIAGLMMSKKAKDNGDRIAKDYGQPEQGAIVNRCADQAVLPAECRPGRFAQPVTPVAEAAAAERESGFTVGENGGPVR